jgi:two-component system response regulator NreC
MTLYHQSRPDRLSKREIEILKLVANGYTSEEVADRLKIACKTVQAHRARITLKLNIHDLANLVKYAIRVGIVAIDEHRPD